MALKSFCLTSVRVTSEDGNSPVCACVPTNLSNCQSGESNDTIISMQILLLTSQLAISTQCQVMLPSAGWGGRNIGVR